MEAHHDNAKTLLVTVRLCAIAPAITSFGLVDQRNGQPAIHSVALDTKCLAKPLVVLPCKACQGRVVSAIHTRVRCVQVVADICAAGLADGRQSVSVLTDCDVLDQSALQLLLQHVERPAFHAKLQQEVCLERHVIIHVA